MIIPDSKQKDTLKSSDRDEEVSSPAQDPPPYTPLPSGSSADPTQSSISPPDLAPTNYLYVKDKNNSVKRQLLLDLNLPPPPASALPPGVPTEDTPHLILDSYNGYVSGEVWVLRRGPSTHGDLKFASKRVRLNFLSHNGSIKARVHLHPLMDEPRPFLSIEAKGHNGAVTVVIPRSFRGQLTLHTDNGQVQLSSALGPRSATLSTFNGTHTYFVGERPRCGRWHTGTSEDGDEVDGVIASSKNGSVKVLYDDEDVPGPGWLGSIIKHMKF